MRIENFMQSFAFDLQLEDASLDTSLSISRRILASLCLGTLPSDAYRAVCRVSEVLMGLSQGRDAMPSLMMMLEDGGADLERAIYFAQAGRGVGQSLADLDWIMPILAARAAIVEKVIDGGWRLKKVARAISRREDHLLLKVDVARSRFGSSLTYWGGKEPALSEIDHPLYALTLDLKSHPLTRVLAGLCIGVGLDDAVLSATELLEAMEDFWVDRKYVGGRLSAILANECDDFQRALFFAGVGRARPIVKEAMTIVIEALHRRVLIWKNVGGNAGVLVPLTSPYVISGIPEACVFDLGDVLEDRDRFLHGQA